MTVIFDFDHTLFDADAFKRRLFSCLEDCGVSQEIFMKVYDRDAVTGDRTRDFDFARYLEALAGRLTCAIGEAERRVMEVVGESEKFLFPGTRNLLKKLKSEEHRLVLFTHGNICWQEMKIRRAGLTRFFDRVAVTAGLKEDAELLLSESGKDRIVMVNDNPEEMRALRVRWPQLRMIGVRGPKGSIEMEGVAVCGSMEEIYTALHAL